MPVGNFHLCALPHQVVLDEAKHLANLRTSVGVKDVRPRPDIPLAPFQDKGKVSRIKAVFKNGQVKDTNLVANSNLSIFATLVQEAEMSAAGVHCADPSPLFPRVVHCPSPS